MNSNSNDDFFGVEHIEQFPPPGLQQKAVQEKFRESNGSSGENFIESQYFGDLGARSDDREYFVDNASTSTFEAEDANSQSGRDFIESQYFSRISTSKEERYANDGEDMKIVKKKFKNNFSQRVLPSEMDSEKERYANDGEEMKIMKKNSKNNFPQRVLSSEMDGEELKEFTEPSRKSAARRKPVITKPVIFDEDFLVEEEGSGIDAILEQIDKVWKMEKDQLLEYLSNRVLYHDDDLIAFDKPYSLPYASSRKSSVQFDRLLKDLRDRLAPNCDHFRVVRTVEKQVSGVLLFAKSEAAHKAVSEKYRNGQVVQQYRAILGRVPRQNEAVINIPLVKVLKGQDFEMKPLLPNGRQTDAALHVSTEFKVMAENGTSASVRCLVRNDVPHQVRAHLGYGLGCAILGDVKYNGCKDFRPRKLNPETMKLLNLAGNDYRRLPMYLHLSEISIPRPGRNSGFIILKTSLPQFFYYTLKKLRLVAR